jgi:hypothetical protein
VSANPKYPQIKQNEKKYYNGEALFSALKNVDAQEFRDGLEMSEKTADTIINSDKYSP